MKWHAIMRGAAHRGAAVPTPQVGAADGDGASSTRGDVIPTRDRVKTSGRERDGDARADDLLNADLLAADLLTAELRIGRLGIGTQGASQPRATAQFNGGNAGRRA